jgi:DNA-binding transcriptional MerR regulator/methylmalonyl-CoA mutase cobalamin-binding subunit
MKNPLQRKVAKAHDAYPLRTVAAMTGLTPDLIRAWEKRYGVVAPRRGPRGARLYSNADVAHLSLLRRVVESGRAIGDVAQLGVRQLQARAATAPLEHADEQPRRGRAAAPTTVINAMIDALERFDSPAVDRLLGDALMTFGTREFIVQVAKPLLDDVGERWSDGRLTIADEHLLSGLLRNLLNGVIRTRGQPAGPTVLLATPVGERHELGLLLAGLMVADAGLRLCYLGTDLPAAEVVGAARRARADVVGLGMVYGKNTRVAAEEVRRLEKQLAPTTELWLGGGGAAAVAARVAPSRALVLDEMESIERQLTRVRAHAAPRT